MLFSAWADDHKMMPGPSNETEFFKAFNPESVIQRYLEPPPAISTWGRSTGAGTDGQTVDHSIEFQADLVIETSREADLVRELHGDLSQTLVATHTRITRREGDSGGEYGFGYKDARSIGVATIQPLEHPFVQHEKPLRPGLEDVRIKIAVQEKTSNWCLRCDATDGVDRQESNM